MSTVASDLLIRTYAKRLKLPAVAASGAGVAAEAAARFSLDIWSPRRGPQNTIATKPYVTHRVLDWDRDRDRLNPIAPQCRRVSEQKEPVVETSVTPSKWSRSGVWEEESE